MHVPDGTRELIPGLPVARGEGGSYSVLAAGDAGDAVRALLDEGRSLFRENEVRMSQMRRTTECRLAGRRDYRTVIRSRKVPDSPPVAV